uniref:Uncharacterized protein n=1 Tax=Ditylenchus dipsaci TaxID=166011 RepID=A0A915EQA4_9BILA
MSTHHKAQQQTWRNRAINLLFCAGGIIVCYSAFSIYQEQITRKSYGEKNERFTYMQALVFIQCAINTVVALVAKSTGKTSLDNVPNSLYSMCSISYFLAMLFSNLALEWVNYPTQVLGKSCKPIPIMIFGVLFAIKGTRGGSTCMCFLLWWVWQSFYSRMIRKRTSRKVISLISGEESYFW